MTVREALAAAASRLGEAGIEHAEADAELLLRHVLGWDRATLVASGDDPLPEQQRLRFGWLIDARAARQPLQHLTGTQAFWRHDFVVGPDVLIPRPETEVLVEHALRVVAAVPRPKVVDVGTGSGCIAISLAAERPDARIVATDVSAPALRVAAGNASRLLPGAGIAFVRGDLLAPFGDGAAFDLVVSNPPYVPEAEWRGLAVEVKGHDPRVALVPDEGVPQLYARLLAGAARVLRPGGAVAVEVGAGQMETIAALAGAAGFASVRPVTDLGGIARVLVGSLGPAR
ncbi:MAG TPA: peptide chain release factor N(5)-glutamine methyltransferase [Longimicrobiaceae bacterium]